jgi:thiol-disulfide isomerase/thioredoxin
MKKETILTGVIGIAVAAILIWFVTGLGSDTSSNTNQSNVEPTTQQNMTPEEAREAAEQRDQETAQKAEASNRYIDYTPEAFASSTTANNVISFDADWCYVCDAIEENILAGEIPEDLTIFKANFDEEIELRKKYGVTSQTTFVQVTPNGDEITKWVMYDVDAGIDEIVAQLQ